MSTELQIQVRQKTRFELIDKYSDNRPLLGLRKSLLRIQAGFSQFCVLIISNSFFEWFIILVISLNITILALEDPKQAEQDETLQLIDFICLYIYTLEALLKIGGMGLLFPKGAYFKDTWNLIDFIIVLTAWVEKTAQEGFNLSALRTLRVLRPLRSISYIEGLRVLITALVSSIKPLLISMVLFVFFLCIFAIAGLQLWMGVFRSRCLNVNAGEFAAGLICGSEECPGTFRCIAGIKNPNYGITSFDNIFYSFLAVFQSVTMEGWANIMITAQKAFSPFAVLYFIPLIFIGAFLLLNLALAVIKSSFTRAMNEVRNSKEQTQLEEDCFTSVDLQEFMLESKGDLNDTVNMSNPEAAESVNTNRLRFMQIAQGLARNRIVYNEPFTVEHDNDSFEANECNLDSREIFTLNKFRNGGQILREIPTFVNDRVLQCKAPRQITQRHSKVVPGTKETLESRAGGSIRARKDVATRIRFKTNPNEFTYFLEGENELVSSSYSDVLGKGPEAPSTIDEYDRERSFVYTTEESGDTHIQPQTAKEFARISLRKPFTQAFFIVVSSSAGLVSQLQEADGCQMKVQGTWSGVDVDPITQDSCAKQSKSLSEMRYRLWVKGPFRCIEHGRFVITSFVTLKLFNTVMTACVIVNTIILSLDHYGISKEMEDTLNAMNSAFT